MNRKNKTIIAILIAAILIAAIGYLLKRNNSFEYQLKKSGISLDDVKDFDLKDVLENKITAEKDGEIVRIEITKNIDQAKADEYFKNQIALLGSVFEPQLPPYPEFLSMQTGCDTKYLPSERESPYGKYFILYAGDRMGYGICADDLIKYKASLGLFYCPSEKTVFKMEYFTSKDAQSATHENMANSFKCL